MNITPGLWHLLADESAQDLAEYTLLIAFIMLSSAALFSWTGQYVSQIWNRTNNDLDAGKNFIGL